jgi:hypothetical protein
MADNATSIIPAEEIRVHQRSYITFERLVLFSVLHIALVLVCLAFAFLADSPTFAVLLAVVGSLATIGGFAIYGASGPK